MLKLGDWICIYFIYGRRPAGRALRATREATMEKNHDLVLAEARAFFGEISARFNDDAHEHGGKSNQPNLARWLDLNGLLARHVEKKAKAWTKKDVLLINDNSRHRVPYGDPHDSAYGALYKDILLELKKLMKK